MKGLRRILSRLGDIKTRTLLILVGIILLIVVGLVLTTVRETKIPDVAGEVKTAEIGEIASLAGTGEYNEEYAQLQLAENQRTAELAQKSGDAAVPRLINQPNEADARLSFGEEYCAECVYDLQGYDEQGYDAKGYDKDGYDANGYDKDGYDKDGFDKDGYDRDGYDKDGFDRNGCNREGLDREGNPCYDAAGYSADGYDRFGYDKDGFDKDGYDKDGYDKDGFDRNGCNREGFDREGKPCFEGYDKDGYDKDGFDRNGCNREGFDREGQPCNGNLELPNVTAAEDSQAAYRKLLEEQQKARDAELSAQQQADANAQLAAQQAAMQQAFEALLQSQSRSVVANWAPSTQAYIRGPNATQTEGVGVGGEGEPNLGTLIYKAGSIVFAVLDTSLNSDEPGPVLATIVQGPLKDSKVIGSLELLDDKLALHFALLSSPDLPASVPVDAVAIDAETARTALATGVDNHYLLRYGSLFASAFLEGIGEAILAGISQPQLEVVDGVVIGNSVDVTTKDALLVGIGTVGKKLGEQLDVFHKPPTVTLDSGTGIGILFMEDFYVGGDVVETPVAATPVSTPENSAQRGEG